MAHLTYIEDKRDFSDTYGDVIDCEYYCSDSCAQESPYYSGWSGCHELHTLEFCQACNVELYSIEVEV